MKGHICKRGKKYYVVVSLGGDASGKRKQKWYSGFETYEKAHEFRDFIQPTLRSYKSLGGFLEHWLENKKSQVRAGTHSSYAWLVEKHIIPNIGDIKLNKLTPLDLQALYDHMRTIGLSETSILHTHRILHSALKSAYRYKLVEENVTDLIDSPRAKRAQLTWWDAATLAKFLEVSTLSKYYTCYVLLAYTGIRLGEATGLKWSDINLEHHVLRVQRSYTHTGHGYKFEPPKTASGRRAIALSPFTIDVLKAHLSHIARLREDAGDRWKENDLVVTTIIGTPVNHSNIRTDFYKLCKQYGLPRIRLHDLRHTHASLLLQQGVHPKVVQERLGHSDIQLTLNTYTHVLPQLQDEAAFKFDQLLSTR